MAFNFCSEINGDRMPTFIGGFVCLELPECNKMRIDRCTSKVEAIVVKAYGKAAEVHRTNFTRMNCLNRWLQAVLLFLELSTVLRSIWYMRKWNFKFQDCFYVASCSLDLSTTYLLLKKVRVLDVG